MGLIWTVVLGALVGWLASIVTKRDAEQGIVGNIIVGIVGAFLGNVVSNLLVGGDRSALVFDGSSLLWALGGAIVLCMILNYINRRKLV